MDQEAFVIFFLSLPLLARAIVLEKMKTHDIINLALFSPHFKAQVNSHRKSTKKVVIEVGNRRLDVIIRKKHVVFGLRNILQLTPLATKDPYQQMMILKDLFKLEVTLKLNDLSSADETCETMFRFYEDFNVVRIDFGDSPKQDHRIFLDQLRPSTMQLMILRNPGLPNFGLVFGRPFDYLMFHNGYQLTVENLLCLNCRNTEVCMTTLREDAIIELLNRWMEGWNPLLNSFVAQFMKNSVQENYIDRVMESVRNTPASIHEDHSRVVPFSHLWALVHQTDRAFTIRGTLVDGGERTARLVFDTLGRINRLKIIALN